MLPKVLEAEVDERAPLDRFSSARAVVVDGQFSGFRGSGADLPRSDQHQVDDHVDGDQVGRLVFVAEHGAEQPFARRRYYAWKTER